MVSHGRRHFYLPRITLTRLVGWLIILITACAFVLLTGFFKVPLGSGSSRLDGGGGVAKRSVSGTDKRYADYQVRSDKVDLDAPGENGAGIMLKGDELNRSEILFKKEAFNIIASDMISLQRSIPDVRDPKCKALKYDVDLPSASVVIIFHNEAWSPLLRTVWSVINRSPPEYLKEIVLLDDKSDREELGEKLEKYVAENFDTNVVRIVRCKERQGLISARVRGAEAATGDVLIFLDSHCEANVGWLEPILSHIKQNPKTMVCPMIDHISDHTIQYSSSGQGSAGGFWWSLHFKWISMQDSEATRRKSHIEPYRLEPILSHIKLNPKTMICPMIDVIGDHDMRYAGVGQGNTGSFWWSLHFKWIAQQESEQKRRKSDIEPYRLEPILSHIKQNPRTMVCPMIDGISDHTIQYGGGGMGSTGGFWWSLHFKWISQQESEKKRRKSDIEPYRLEPLLQRIKDHPKHMLCPNVDAVNDKTLSYSLNGGSAQGGFTWSMHFTWEPVKDDPNRKSSTDPIRSPTMAGGLFASDRKWFFEVGAYDPGMDVWGGENLEISFRVWMCHGALEFIPCSRVGHIFRASHPYTFTGRDGVKNKDTHGINSGRLAEVWMDDYKRLFYFHRQQLEKEKDSFGDLTDRKALRERLKCHDFKWYLDNVIPEKFIPDEDVQVYGQVKNPKTGFCLDMLGKDEKLALNIGIYFCQGKSEAQFFSLSKKGEIRREESCADLASFAKEGDFVKLHPCHGKGASQFFTFEQDGQIKNPQTGMCFDAADLENAGDVKVRKCDDTSETQKWTIDHAMYTGLT